MDTQRDPRSIKIALLAGGNSKEREISLASGKSVYKALQSSGFYVRMLDPARKEDLITLIEESFDVAFLALHGKGGEDGAIQGFLETIQLPYTGSGIWSSATAVNKILSKKLYEEAQIPTPSFMEIMSQDVSAEEVEKTVGSHCVIKAATEGSALGIYICEDRDAIADAITKVFEVDSLAFAETFVAGQEYTVGVLGEDEPYVLPVIQIIPKNEFYDFESKYATGGSQHICPAPLSEQDTVEAQRLALAAHDVLQCEGVSRTDLIQDEHGQFWVLETNTLPGMTSTSLLPDAAQVYGLDFNELCTRMVFDALSK